MNLAATLTDLAAKATGTTPPFRLRAWDGSEAGPDDGGPVLWVRDPDALRRLVWRPGELGLAQAYVLGEIDVEGDLSDGLRRLHRAAGSVRASTGLRAGTAAIPFALRHPCSAPARPRPAPRPPSPGDATAATATARSSATTTTSRTNSTSSSSTRTSSTRAGTGRRPTPDTPSPTPRSTSST
ncbi:hypothetical protein GCM10029992_54310 [Glycomyces albus]